MLRVERILYPTDFSESSRQALPYAVSLARRFDADLHVLHVLVLHAADPAALGNQFPIPAETIDAWANRAAEEMEELAAEHVGEELTVHQELTRAISAPPAILEHAEESDVDLVVMGTHGRRGLRHLVVGSVTEEVARTAPCPVLTVRQLREETPRTRFRRILVPVDFSEPADFALDHAAELADAFGARLHLTYVVEQVTYPDFYYPAAGMRDEMIAHIQEQARDQLEERLTRIRDAGVEAEFSVETGPPATRIAELVGELESDLVVIGSHGRTGVQRMLLGSVAEGVIRRSVAPVLVIRTDEKSLVA